MIFKDILVDKSDILSKEFDKLLELAFEKQSHRGDLLLWNENGFSSEQNGQEPPAYLIGPSLYGHSEHTHYQFIDEYRRNPCKYTSKEFLEIYNQSKGTKQMASIKLSEEISISMEMLIYLKFWEADMTIKKFYQLVGILQGKPYDWNFKLAKSNRDNDGVTGKRCVVIREMIRDPLKAISPTLYSWIKDTYKTQIRNAIAHSNYYFSARSIGLLNYFPSDGYSNLKTIAFEDWTEIFHNTLVLHNQYVRLGKLIHQRYTAIYEATGQAIPVLIPRKDDKGDFERLLELDKASGYWQLK